MSLDWRTLLKLSRDFYERAKKEFEEAVSEDDILSIRDSSEKAWNAVVQATNALILALAHKLPASHFERRKILRELEGKYSEIERLGIADRYMARYKVLHGETFYEGIIDIEQLKVEFKKVKKYIEDIEKLLMQVT
ncbi:MAG: hypothetical protein DRN15_01615 [Thermoprotei archaeon]|nr:MAG: hypothetical protein DRM97_05865 [Thermoprotei archaeon]RLF24973.1 MAG: hypothetical protein DRN15_01615 [Thermoprotei archaeon]